ncbi:hypothetical protein D9M68_697640 [compost metagenome]
MVTGLGTPGEGVGECRVPGNLQVIVGLERQRVALPCLAKGEPHAGNSDRGVKRRKGMPLSCSYHDVALGVSGHSSVRQAQS